MYVPPTDEGPRAESFKYDCVSLLLCAYLLLNTSSAWTEHKMDDNTYRSESGSEDDIMDIHSLCHLCALHDTCLIPLFGDEGKQYDLEVKVEKYLPIKLSEDIDMPHSVCYKCAAILLSWHSLYTKCIEAQKKLKSLSVIAMAYRMSNKESQHDGLFFTEEHNISTKLECDSLYDDESTISGEMLHSPEDPVKSDASRIQALEMTEMTPRSSLQVMENSDFSKFNEEQCAYFSRTGYIHPCLNRPDNEYPLPRAQEIKEEPTDWTSDSENVNSCPLLEERMCNSKDVNNVPEFVCGHCNEKFSVWGNLDYHFRNCHHSSQKSSRKWYSEGLPEDSFVQVFHCMVCDRSFLHTAEHFMLHMKAHERTATALLDHDYC